MKKLLTLLMAVTAFASVQAQTTKDDARRIILGEGSNNKNYPTNESRDIILGGDNRNSYPTYPNNYPTDNRNRKFKKVHANGGHNDNCNNNGKHKGWSKKAKNKNWKKGHRD